MHYTWSKIVPDVISNGINPTKSGSAHLEFGGASKYYRECGSRDKWDEGSMSNGDSILSSPKNLLS